MKNIKNRGAVVITVEMRVFLAPGLFKNIKRSIVDGVGVGEMDFKDALLKEEVAKRYDDKPVKLWALKETLRERWTTIENRGLRAILPCPQDYPRGQSIIQIPVYGEG